MRLCERQQLLIKAAGGEGEACEWSRVPGCVPGSPPGCADAAGGWRARGLFSLLGVLTALIRQQ